MTRRRKRRDPIDWGQERQALYRRPETDPGRQLLIAYQTSAKFTAKFGTEDMVARYDPPDMRTAILAGVDEIVRLRHENGRHTRKILRQRDHYRTLIRKLMATSSAQQAELRQLNEQLNEALKGNVEQILEAQRTKHRAVVAELRAELAVYQAHHKAEEEARLVAWMGSAAHNNTEVTGR